MNLYQFNYVSLILKRMINIYFGKLNLPYDVINLICLYLDKSRFCERCKKSEKSTVVKICHNCFKIFCLKCIKFTKVECGIFHKKTTGLLANYCWDCERKYPDNHILTICSNCYI